MVKHRQLARQVGAFGGFEIERSMDLDNMIFSTGSTFTFGSWICEADSQGKLQGRLLEDRKDQEDLILSARSTEELVERFLRLAMSESLQVSPTIEFNSNSETESTSETNLGFFHDKPGSFPMGLRNSASIHQEINSSLLQNPSMKLGPFPIDLNIKILPRPAPRKSRTSARATADRSTGRPHTSHDISRLPRPLAGFYFQKQPRPTS
jgi:hypothetical protein